MKIKIKAVYRGVIMVIYVEQTIKLDPFLHQIRDTFGFNIEDVFTIKFIDDEGDPCTISSKLEFEEALRLTLDIETDKQPEMIIHIFPGTPREPGEPCPGEDKSIYRRGARRWRKIYKVNGHSFQPRRFNKVTPCIYCGDQIWGLGRQGFKCLSCKLMVHKKCHKLLQTSCTGQQITRSTNGSSIRSSTDLKAERWRNRTPKDRARSRHSKQSHSSDSSTADNNRQKSPAPTPTPPATANSDQAVELIVAENGARHRPYRLDDFDLIRVIGRGSYAKVLLVQLRETKRPYAMKVIKKEIVAADEDIDWVQTEKHVFEIATGCDFLVGLHSCFQTEAKLFFVIEFVSGGDLMFHMQRKRRLPEDHARFYAAEISLALNYLHEKGIIYRDLKLDNVLLDQYGHIKLTDYGMCKEGMRPGDTTITFCGTPNYIAPEIIRGCEYSFSIDWWALGVLLYEMLIGRSPFDIPKVSDSGNNGDSGGESSEDALFKAIVTRAIRISRSISVKAQNVLKGFLDKNPETRLGCNPDGSGFQDIKNHPFFRPLDWELLAEKKVIPPYIPKIDDDPLEHFDPAFTTEPIQLTPPDLSIIDTIDQSEFEGFEFINPEIMTVEEAV
ncbi:protein kinase C iota type [Tetranychus urticae]|uniref:protein kinase C n=1 Tax=Tetranychus urticae TaxID=32264 RepID=T1L2J9_TETUR|nr:protein kinase C iota type [Tetranychus urticae]